MILIGHGSFDGVEYKFNLVGPDISGEELATLCDRIPSRAATDRQYDQLERRLDLGSRKARPRGDRGNQDPERRKMRRSSPATGSRLWKIRRSISTRTTRSAHLRHFSMRTARRRIFIHRRSAWRRSTPSLTTPARANPCARHRPTAGRDCCSRIGRGAHRRGAASDQRSGQARIVRQEGRARAEDRRS